MIEGLTPHIEQAIRSSGARIVITGAGGWIGMATLELLVAALGQEFAARVISFGSSWRRLQLLDGNSIEQLPLAEITGLEPAPTILLHLAFLTKDRAEAMDEAEYRAANRALGQIVLDALGPIGAEAIFVASSGAAKYADDPQATPAMRLYGSLKREQEDLFAAWADQQCKRAVIARIFNISGPHINKQHSYALATFIIDALAGRPIAIRAPHQVVRSYVAVRELVSLVFALLLDGTRDVTRFDSGGDPMEMQAIAQAVADHVGEVSIHRPPRDPATIDQYTGDGRAYRALLAQHRISPMPFTLQVAETIDYLSFFQKNQLSDGLALDRPA